MTDELEQLSNELATKGAYPHLVRYKDGTWGCQLANSVLGIWPYETGATATAAVRAAWTRFEYIQHARAELAKK